MSKINNSNIICAILVSLTLSVATILIPTAAFADDGENIFTYLFGQLYGNEYDARIPNEAYNDNKEIKFNNNWMTKDTTQYNNALSSFCANCSEKIEQNKDSIYYYLKENNFGNAYFGGDEKPNGWSGFYCISHKTVEVDGKQSVVLFICCRGTQRLSEVIGDYFHGNNVNFLNSQIYDNVYDFEENVYEGLINYSENHYIDENHFVKLKDMMSNNLKVIVTGHSLGGAAANAVAAKLNYEAGSDNWWLHKIQKSDVCAYTYGAIKVLGDNYNDETNLEEGYENIHNVYNWSDSFGPYGSKQHLRVSVPNKKFGHTETFDNDKHDFGLWPFFPFETTYTASHNMPTYIEAINNEAVENKQNNNHYLELYCSDNYSGDWKNAYIDFINNLSREYKDGNSYCMLANIFNCNEPALFVKGEAHGTGFVIAQYYEGKVVYQKIRAWLKLKYIKEENILLNTDWNWTGYLGHEVFKFDNGNFAQLFIGYHGLPNNNGVYDSEHKVWKIDNKDVSEQEYYFRLNNVFDESRAKDLDTTKQIKFNEFFNQLKTM